MNIYAAHTPPVPPPQPLAQQAPQQQNPAVASAIVSAQQVAKPVGTQTVRAAAPTGKAEAARETKDSKTVGHGVDKEADAVRARTAGQRRQGLGQLLDILV